MLWLSAWPLYFSYRYILVVTWLIQESNLNEINRNSEKIMFRRSLFVLFLLALYCLFFYLRTVVTSFGIFKFFLDVNQTTTWPSTFVWFVVYNSISNTYLRFQVSNEFRFSVITNLNEYRWKFIKDVTCLDNADFVIYKKIHKNSISNKNRKKTILDMSI